MIIRKTLLLLLFPLFGFQFLWSTTLIEQFNERGYGEICNSEYGTKAFESLYDNFDELIKFLRTNKVWMQKLYIAKERFIRSKERDYYSTDFFGFYDESDRKEKSQISFYYSVHFHKFICVHFPEFNEVPQIVNFLKVCLEIQKPYGALFDDVAVELGLDSIFSSDYGCPPLLLKVIKYLPSYITARPHYDGTAFTLFLDSTDNQSLHLSPYKFSLTTDDFSSPLRKFSRGENQNSILLIPGMFLTEFSIFPTPHIVRESGKTRYSTVVFAMRPHYTFQKIDLTPLPSFKK